MKQLTIILATTIILIFSSLTTVAQVKTTIPDEIHLLQNPFKPMNILIKPIAIDGIDAQAEDLVMAFDGNVCVGAAVIKDVNEILNLVATSSDEVNKGYKSGQLIRLEYHSASDNTVYELVPGKILLGSMNYEELGTLYAEFRANVLSINESENIPKIKVYPNPVSHQLHIVMQTANLKPNGKLNLKIINITGMVLIAKEYAANQSVINLDVAGLPAGEYTLLLTSASTRFTQKVIKK